MELYPNGLSLWSFTYCSNAWLIITYIFLYKKVFLVTIILARWASKLGALHCDLHFLQFFRDKVVPITNMYFLPKNVSDFHIQQFLELLIFFLSPTADFRRLLHRLDVHRALAFYISRTKAFWKISKPFVCCQGKQQGNHMPLKRTSKWLVHAISLCYQLAQNPLPESLKGIPPGQ